MTPLLIVVCSGIVLLIGYIVYGGWLAKQWGVDPGKKTPAEELADGVDYVVAKPAVLLGHHFSSIAGAGPINGPIQAAVFGWVPVCLWCVFGGIFFGGVHDFGSLFASVRHGGRSIGDVVKSSMGTGTKRLFIVFMLIVLLLVIASFVNVVASTFFTSGEIRGVVNLAQNATADAGKQTTAMVSVLFIVIAIIYGIITTRLGLKTLPATILGIIGIVIITAIGLKFGLALSRTTWIVLIGVYITVASLAPVWILLQPRDYLSSFLLYAMMILAVVGLAIFAVKGQSYNSDYQIQFALPAFGGWKTGAGSLFPALFITVACGACSGFHSLVSSGTTSKQLDNEKSAKLIGYGGMLIESLLGVVSLVAVGMVAGRFITTNAETGIRSFAGAPPVAFAAGIASFFGFDPANNTNPIYTLLTLAVSVFALTSLDTGTRLGRFAFAELFMNEGENSRDDIKDPVRKFLTHPLVGTLFMVILGCVLGGLSLTQIWSLFGAANQLLAGIALMAIATWLMEIGKSNKMVLIPMAFMLAATLSQLCIIVKNRIVGLAAGFAEGDAAKLHWGNWFQLIFAGLMVILAVILVIEGVKTFSRLSKSGSGQRAA